jgi:hypothetical protein
MNSNRSRRIALTLGAAAGGLLAAAFLPMAVANADDFVYTPDFNNLVGAPGTAFGLPGLFGGLTEIGAWNANDLSNSFNPYPDDLIGGDFHTTILTFTNDLFTVVADGTPSGLGHLASNSTIDYDNFGLSLGGNSAPFFGNEFIDAAAGSTSWAPGFHDILITPIMDFALY